MGLLRSEVMKRGTLIIPSHRARKLMDLLGRHGGLQLLDMNATSLRRQYKRYIQRIEEMERKLRFLFELIGGLSDVEICQNDPSAFLECDYSYQLEKVESTLNKLYDQFLRFRDNNLDLQNQRNSTLEEQFVVSMAVKYTRLGRRVTQDQFQKTAETNIPLRTSFEHSARQALLSHDTLMEEEYSPLSGYSPSVMFSSIAGVISTEAQHSFERILFHTTRGNSFGIFEQITEDDPQAKGKPLGVSAFVVYYQGSSQSIMAEKIRNVCTSFDCRIYDWITDPEEGQKRLTELPDKLLDKEKTLQAYEQYFKKEIAVLLEVAQPSRNSLIEDWRLFCIKEKAIYCALNLFEGEDIHMRVNCWFPASQENELRLILSKESQPEQVSALLLTDDSPVKDSPPTFTRSSDFTSVFQAIVDTYGIPRYREANPALFTTATLPFLFAIMYGDIGHGLCIFLMGLFLFSSYFNVKSLGDIGGMLYDSRYLIVLMGFFSVFCGSLYNEFFGLGLSIFGTRWVEIPTPHSNSTISHWNPSSGFPYPYGMDPKWKGAVNELSYLNSFKMKFSVIMAFVQMLGGILLKGSNTLHFNSPLDFIFEFLPQIILFISFVGYMAFLIIFKWMTPLTVNKPNLIQVMVKLSLFQRLQPNEVMFASQQRVQYNLLMWMVISIVLMVLPKPLILWAKKSVEERRRMLPMAQNGELMEPEKEEGEGVMDLFLHQFLEATEFILGILSNTASYLRLWALSLAHQQLSVIFFEKTVFLAFSGTNMFVMTLALFLLVTAFTCVTAGALLAMDSVECFLHALRLQWVEFQNKFYKADGVKFEPFELRRILAEVPVT
ncbi:putative vacuolar proton translocating ATPase subunit [Cardiosporidium cionae]|uniref:V-type proton ATPase subunit a n=1 Tax=Cardiosporidium cionae TaxID=476202 RepID=A0ABQ7JFH5_9APIC|nr:putative vacuolar proton translocating ATPase subunit [Cardiosporidium cionae]|eukprot:KAF8822723.1 putative vacuolar proton translocating ATPase subunit [Cardiosporidium cionae]